MTQRQQWQTKGDNNPHGLKSDRGGLSDERSVGQAQHETGTVGWQLATRADLGSHSGAGRKAKVVCGGGT